MPSHAPPPPEWSSRIGRLLRRLSLTQAALAERLGISPATVSRWITGALEPNAENYVALGNLAGAPEGIYFWERAGMEPSRLTSPQLRPTHSSLQVKLKDFSIVADSKLSRRLNMEQSAAIVIPLLNITAYGDRIPPQGHVSLSEAKIEELLMAPLHWCPNPENAVAMHVHGDSMAPLIREEALLVVDTAVTERDHLHQKLAVFSHRDHGFKLARFQRLPSSDILVSANHQYPPIDVSDASRWKPFGRVLWWISRDEELEQTSNTPGQPT